MAAGLGAGGFLHGAQVKVLLTRRSTLNLPFRLAALAF